MRNLLFAIGFIILWMVVNNLSFADQRLVMPPEEKETEVERLKKTPTDDLISELENTASKAERYFDETKIDTSYISKLQDPNHKN